MKCALVANRSHTRNHFACGLIGMVATAVLAAGCAGTGDSHGSAKSSTTSASVASVDASTASSTASSATSNQGDATPVTTMTKLREKVSRAGLPCADSSWSPDYTPLKGADEHGYCGNAALLVTYVDQMFNGSDALIDLSERQRQAAAAGHRAPTIFSGGTGAGWYMMCTADNEDKCRRVEGAVFLM